MKFSWIFPTLLSVLCQIFEEIEGARILGIFPLEIPDHFVMYQEVLKGLADRGHKVDVVSPYGLKRSHENYTTLINLAGKSSAMKNNLTGLSVKNVGGDYSPDTYGNKICELLDLPDFQSLVKTPPKDPPYDLVIAELFYANCYLAFGRHLNVSVVAISPEEMPNYLNEPVGNPLNTAFVSQSTYGSFSAMNFWQRFKNTLWTAWSNFRIRRTTEVQNEIIKKHFGSEMPGVRELERELALVLVNSHHSINGIRPKTPAVVEVGGLHIREERTELTPEFKNWLNESTSGFIYVTFGSIIKIDSFPRETIAELYKGFGKISPIRVLLKVGNSKKLPPAPKNVIMVKSVPQLEIFRHPNLKGFVTNGGITGIQEAVVFKIPIIGIPMISNQPRLIKNCVDKGIAVSLDYEDITESNFVSAVNDIVNDPKYKANLIAVSRQFLNRPTSSKDAAIFWIEHVIKHGGSLRSPATKLSWWQLSLLDIYATILITISTILYLSKIFLLILVRRLKRTDATLPTSKKMV
ncbi:UDP-glucosyltransferase 2-like [Athalia rosae]|uniref:UDP-glucosyltransferase 2-like n=1 Tax=Athalia rosae TaxID=37344 RepID=UPI0020336BE5|nr:UDP-glucosyltransferase 2-like [Athalia rosae]